MAEPDPAAWVAASRDRLEQDILRLALTEASVASGVHGDLRRALKALDAVLKRHQPKTVTVREMCGAHAWGTKAGRSVPLGEFQAEVDACTDCTSRLQVECTGCNPECPDDSLWEKCPERAAIAGELLSEEEQ
jgi:hypothetical protein